jgi:hypothetical protein
LIVVFIQKHDSQRKILRKFCREKVQKAQRVLAFVIFVRFCRQFKPSREFRQVLDCGSPLPLWNHAAGGKAAEDCRTPRRKRFPLNFK